MTKSCDIFYICLKIEKHHMKYSLLIILFIPILVSSCLTTSDLVEATPLGKGNNSIDLRANGQVITALLDNSQPGDIGFPVLGNLNAEYSRGITESGDIGVALFLTGGGISFNWKQNVINNEKYAFALRPSIGYNALFMDQYGLDILNTFKISVNKNFLLNASLFGNGFIAKANDVSFLSESMTAGMTFGTKHKFKVGLTAANFIQTFSYSSSNSDFLPLYVGLNLAYQLSW